MTKHHLVHDIVSNLTDNASFRTFFTLYLMAGSIAQRRQIEQSFWKEVNRLSQEQQQVINEEFSQTFRRIPILLEQLKNKISSQNRTALST